VRKPNVKLRNAIFEEGLTQKAVAAECGIPESVVSMIVNGKYVPDDHQKRRIAQTLGKYESELFKGDNR